MRFARAQLADDSEADTLFQQALAPTFRCGHFSAVDCFWMQAGHAIYGGYMKDSPSLAEAGRYERALAVARTVLETPAAG